MLNLLGEAQRRGLVGPAPLHSHLDNARGFLKAASRPPDGPAVDIGTGAGLPGLLLALSWPSTVWLLVDARRRAADFVKEAVGRLGLEHRVDVAEARVEEIGRRNEHRTGYALAVTRAFGPPASAAEAAAPLLRQGGMLVVSEPPKRSDERWPDDGLAALGMEKGPLVATADGHFQVIYQRSVCSGRFPRRSGVSGKRPLF